jgi:Sec-independent protein secretion pathway component TatC
MSSIHYIYSEMRYRVLYFLYSIFCTSITCYYCQLELIYLLSRPFIYLHQTLQTTSIGEALSTTFSLCIYVSIAVSMLTLFYQYWSFIVASCYKFERKKYTLFFICFIFILVLEIFCIYFYILPIVSSFFSSFQVYVDIPNQSENIGNHLTVSWFDSKDHTNPLLCEASTSDFSTNYRIIEMSPRIESLLVSTRKIIGVLCLVFQIPWIFLLLFYFEYCNCFTISRYRKPIYFFIVCIGALFSPPDLLSQFAFCIVLAFFFELSLWIGCVISIFKSFFKTI